VRTTHEYLAWHLCGQFDGKSFQPSKDQIVSVDEDEEEGLLKDSKKGLNDAEKGLKDTQE
jgi:hypothetical protein